MGKRTHQHVTVCHVTLSNILLLSCKEVFRQGKRKKSGKACDDADRSCPQSHPKVITFERKKSVPIGGHPRPRVTNRRGHSFRNATTGSTFVARRAGK